MEYTLSDQPEIRDIPLPDINQRYEKLRIVDPKADRAIYRSMSRYGQFLPVIAANGDAGQVELLDGFKRLRAARDLKLDSLRVRVMHLNARAGKAMLLQLNWQMRSISAVEEALIVHSLYHDDKLGQLAIATLLGRHKSWVCRRIALLERLCDEAMERIRLGLIPVSICRELVRLPRGNQEQLLDIISHHRLTCRETGRLVDALLARPQQEHPKLLAHPRQLADESKAALKGYSRPILDLERVFRAVEGHCRTMAATLKLLESNTLNKQEQRFLAGTAEPLAARLTRTAELLRTIEVQP